jgi:DNA-binding transcriptional regulator PaaX
VVTIHEIEVGIVLREWLLLHYKVPREPSANRVYVWRKLKRMGAVILHDSIWVLPNNSRTLEQFQWLAAEITELEGEAIVWTARLNQPEQEAKIIQQFEGQIAEEYRQILAELAQSGVDLAALGKRYRQAKTQDYFDSNLGETVRQALISAEGDTA